MGGGGGKVLGSMHIKSDTQTQFGHIFVSSHIAMFERCHKAESVPKSTAKHCLRDTLNADMQLASWDLIGISFVSYWYLIGILSVSYWHLILIYLIASRSPPGLG